MVVHRFFEAIRDPLAIVCFQLVCVERNIKLAKGIVPLRRDRHVALQVDRRFAVGKAYTDDRQQSHGNHRQGKFAGVLLRCLCLGGCIAAHTAAAIRAEVLAVVDLFTTMYTNHFIVPPCVLPAVLLGLFFLPYTISIGACSGNVKADLKKICRAQKIKRGRDRPLFIRPSSQHASLYGDSLSFFA